jgi:hypothetical protein
MRPYLRISADRCVHWRLEENEGEIRVKAWSFKRRGNREGWTVEGWLMGGEPQAGQGAGRGQEDGHGPVHNIQSEERKVLTIRGNLCRSYGDAKSRRCREPWLVDKCEGVYE